MTTAATKTKKKRGPRRITDDQPPVSAVLGHGDLATSLLFVFPLFLVYEVSVLFAPAMNGVDFVSRNLFVALGRSKQNYLLFHVALAVIFAGLLVWKRRSRTFDARRLLPMLLEAGIFALTAGTLIVFVMTHVLHMSPPLAAGGLEHGWTGVVLSLGAGVHEELVFRLGLCAGGGALLRLCGVSHGTAMTIAFFASSALFSAAHHIGAYGDPWSMSVFTYRLLAGLLFASLFYFRSLAHSVYTHALYDLYVMLILH
jgi:hypothetical protein